MLVARNLAKSFGSRRVLDGVDLSVEQGSSLAVVGPSGCGKTTLLYLLCGLVRPDDQGSGQSGGQVLLDGAEVRGPGRDIAIILQDYGLLPWKTVQQNVALGLKIAGVGRAERRRRAEDQLLAMGLAGRGGDYPACLSGGEQQRVAIARAFAGQPRLLLMDEPFSSLDAITREKLQDALLATWRQSRVPYVLVTHSVQEAVVLGARIMIMAGSPARVAAVLDNPGFGDPGHRDSPAAFALTRELRKLMGELF